MLAWRPCAPVGLRPCSRWQPSRVRRRRSPMAEPRRFSTRHRSTRDTGSYRSASRCRSSARASARFSTVGSKSASTISRPRAVGSIRCGATAGSPSSRSAGSGSTTPLRAHLRWASGGQITWSVLGCELAVAHRALVPGHADAIDLAAAGFVWIGIVSAGVHVEAPVVHLGDSSHQLPAIGGMSTAKFPWDLGAPPTCAVITVAVQRASSTISSKSPRSNGTPGAGAVGTRRSRLPARCISSAR